MGEEWQVWDEDVGAQREVIRGEGGRAMEGGKGSKGEQRQ